MAKTAQITAPSFTIEDGVLTIKFPLTEPTPSKSGKSLTVASTHGNLTTSATVHGKPVVVGLNAYIRA